MLEVTIREEVGSRADWFGGLGGDFLSGFIFLNMREVKKKVGSFGIIVVDFIFFMFLVFIYFI